MIKFKISLCLLFLIGFVKPTIANDSIFVKVHFLYGSKPKKEFRDVEKKWFGGKLGGHVGIEVDSNKIIDFGPVGKFHYFSHKKDYHSQFFIHDTISFWEVFGGKSADFKKLTINIPVSVYQKMKLDSVAAVYCETPPYDYAFVGMRCGAAAYDVLSQLDLLKNYSNRKIIRKIFYPKKLRKLLLKKAHLNSWTILEQAGTEQRNWEKD